MTARIRAMLVATLTVLSAQGHAQSYVGYDAFYADRPGAVFGAPLEHERDAHEPDAKVLYVDPDEPGVFAQRQAKLGRRTFDIALWGDRIAIDGRTYRFADAIAFSGAFAAPIYPGSAEVFVAGRTDIHPPLLCVEGHGSASGEASSRYTQILLVIDPLARKPVLLLLPRLLSSCRAVVATHDGTLAFPGNRYLFDDAHALRIGLLVSYYRFDGRHFVPTGDTLRLRFVEPDNPFRFSLQRAH
ncbi:hypothetical protein BPS26883_05955 [Burkholderia pseudomultivorans]|uniref:Uncharacterized protein n=2 Tax=Burkholderia pseudomultivorans TaxID=1207504 RepID=A0A6P2QI78_9BURK|nr:hypothetical protein BPS26883_05955 [Burkholderia pseudomultivorans]